MELIDVLPRREIRDKLTKKYNWSMPEQTVNHFLNSLILKGIIEREERGKYKLTEAGKLFRRAIEKNEKN